MSKSLAQPAHHSLSQGFYWDNILEQDVCFTAPIPLCDGAPRCPFQLRLKILSVAKHLQLVRPAMDAVERSRAVTCMSCDPQRPIAARTRRRSATARQRRWPSAGAASPAGAQTTTAAASSARQVRSYACHAQCCFMCPCTHSVVTAALLQCETVRDPALLSGQLGFGWPAKRFKS